MKRSLHSLVDFLTLNELPPEGETNKNKKHPKTPGIAKKPGVVLLGCPDTARFLEFPQEQFYIVESHGAAVSQCYGTLDYALRRLEIPVLCILVHEDCQVLAKNQDTHAYTDAEMALYQETQEILAGVEGPKKRMLSYCDGQVAMALERYGDLVKKEKLIIAGLYYTAKGALKLLNCNGIRGKEALVYSLPDVDARFFSI